MSNHRRFLGAFSIGGLCLAFVSQAHADNPLETWARWVTAQRGAWKGQTVAYPEIERRPASSAWVICSDYRELCVHASSELTFDDVQAALAAVEAAQDLIDHVGFWRPLPDGGRGGTQQHDVYLVDDDVGAPLGHLDAPYVDGNLDGAITFTTLPRTTTPDRLESCAVAALTESALYSRDPAEAQSWRRATGAFVALLGTGAPGCDERALVDQQQAPHRGWITDAEDSGAGGALLLSLLSDRTDRGTGTFVRGLWELSRQWTWEGERLRGSPDVWEAMTVALKNAHEALPQVIEDFAVARYFARPGLTAAYPSLRELPVDALVPVEGPITRAQLPAHLHLGDPPLEVFGSSYVLVDTSGLDPMGQLRVWLRGELGVEWSMVAVRLNAEGGEVGRVVAPPRRDPRSYFPVELLGETARALIVVTNLGKGTPDADIEATRAHAFSLLIDSAQ